MNALLKPIEPPRLRPMQEDDLDTVLSIERQAYPFPWTPGIFRDCLRAGYNCWVMDGRDGMVGYGVMSVAVGEAHILNLCVHPEVQGQGLGRRMLGHLLHLARRHGADISLLEVRPSNTGALRLYDKMGYNEVGRRPSYYPAHGGREDAIIMARNLIEGEAYPAEWWL